MKKLLATCAAAALAVSPAFAAPQTVAGGVVKFTSLFDLADNGLTADVSGTAQVQFESDAQPVSRFLIAPGTSVDDTTLGGTLNLGGGMSISDGSETLSFSNFVLSLPTFDGSSAFDSAGEISADWTTSSGSGTTTFAFTPARSTVLITGDPFDDLDSFAFNADFTASSSALITGLFSDSPGANPEWGVGQAFASVELNPFGAADSSPVPVPGAALLFIPTAAFFWMRSRRVDGIDQ